MQRTHTISRPSYGKQPSTSLYGVLDGVTVKYRPPNIPRPVHLSGIMLPQFPGHRGFSHDFCTENGVIEERNAAHLQIAAQASITRQTRQRMEKAAAAQRKPDKPVVVVPQGPILTPTPAPVSANGNGIDGSTGLSPNLNLMDFETAGDPFETVTLKSINERAELESIWGPSPQVEAQLTVAQPVPPPQPSPQVTAQTAPGIPVTSGQLVGMNQSLVGGVSLSDRAPSPDAQGRPVPKPRRFVPPKQGAAEPQQLGTSPAALPQGLAAGGPPAVVPVLVNMRDTPPPVVTQTPAPVTAAATTTQPPTLGRPSPPLGRPSPPPIAPKPKGASPAPPVVPPPYTSTTTARTRSPTNLPPLNHQPVLNNHATGLPSQAGQPPHAVGGIRVLPAIGITPQLPNPAPSVGVDIPPAYTASSVPSQPPPPAYSAPPVAAPPPPRPTPPVSQYKLEDVRENLEDSELDEVLQIAAMGFDEARVARTYKRLKKDQVKVLDFLFLVGNLEELGFNGNSAETALINCGGKTELAVDYLKEVMRYKEMGYKEKGIHEAYQKSDKDWDKALDILLQQH